jgi:hypothetical protein
MQDKKLWLAPGVIPLRHVGKNPVNNLKGGIVYSPFSVISILSPANKGENNESHRWT